MYINYIIYFACFSVCLYQINVKTAEPIGHKYTNLNRKITDIGFTKKNCNLLFRNKI